MVMFALIHVLTNNMYDWFPVTVAVRLVNGDTEYKGRVEVYYNGTWGTVCDDGWDLNDAEVVCRQLGYGPAIEVAYYGSGSSQIWLNYVGCNGTESAIEECSHGGWGYNHCGHEEDVGVRCADINGL